MRTWTKFKEDYLAITDDSTDNETQGETYINDSIRTVCNLQGGKLRFLETVEEILTVEDQEAYEIPNNIRKVIDVWVQVGSGTTATIYMPEMIFDPTRWKVILAYRLGTNDFPYFTYVENRKIKLQPIPSSNDNILTLRGRKQIKDLSIADYEDGTITTATLDGTTIVGSGTTWTSGMVGQYIKISDGNASNLGDNMWYEIASITDTTHLELVKPYQGTSIVAGSASYIIGQTSVIPEAYDTAVVYRSGALYWQDKGDTDKSKRYWMMYDGGKEAGYSNDYGGIILEMLENEGETEEGAYIPPAGRGGGMIMQAPYYFPYQLATGFS